MGITLIFTLAVAASNAWAAQPTVEKCPLRNSIERAPAESSMALYHELAVHYLTREGFKCGSVTGDANPIPKGDPEFLGRLVEGRFNPKSGAQCIGTIPGYNGPVAILIPARYRPTKKANPLIFFHGNNSAPEYDLPTYLHKYDYLKSLNESGRNQIMILPLGRGSPAREFSELTDPAKPERFQSFLSHAGAILSRGLLAQSPEIGTTTLVSHSNGYIAVSNILKHPAPPPSVRNVYLLDSMYSDMRAFSEFAKDPNHRFWSAYGPYYQPGYCGTPNAAAMAFMKADQTPFVHFPQGKAPKKENFMHDLSSQESSANRVGFIQTDGNHPNAMKNYLPSFLSGGREED